MWAEFFFNVLEYALLASEVQSTVIFIVAAVIEFI